MLVGKPKSVLLDAKHYRTVRRMARTSHRKIYEQMHEIIDQHLARMNTLDKLANTGATRK